MKLHWMICSAVVLFCVATSVSASGLRRHGGGAASMAGTDCDNYNMNCAKCLGESLKQPMGGCRYEVDEKGVGNCQWYVKGMYHTMEKNPQVCPAANKQILLSKVKTCSKAADCADDHRGFLAVGGPKGATVVHEGYCGKGTCIVCPEAERGRKQHCRRGEGCCGLPTEDENVAWGSAESLTAQNQRMQQHSQKSAVENEASLNDLDRHGHEGSEQMAARDTTHHHHHHHHGSSSKEERERKARVKGLTDGTDRQIRDADAMGKLNHRINGKDQNAMYAQAYGATTAYTKADHSGPVHIKNLNTRGL